MPPAGTGRGRGGRAARCSGGQWCVGAECVANVRSLSYTGARDGEQLHVWLVRQVHWAIADDRRICMGLLPHVHGPRARSFGQVLTCHHTCCPQPTPLQTSQVVDAYRYNSPANDNKLLPPATVHTTWAVQVGLAAVWGMGCMGHVPRPRYAVCHDVSGDRGSCVEVGNRPHTCQSPCCQTLEEVSLFLCWKYTYP